MPTQGARSLDGPEACEYAQQERSSLPRLVVGLALVFGCAASPRPGEHDPDTNGSGVAAELLFENRPVADPARVGLGFFSHAGVGDARNHVHADDFRLPRPARLHAVRIWAMAEGADTLDDFVWFGVRIHDGRGGGSPQVGVVLAEARRARAEVTVTATGRRGSGIGEASTRPELTFDLTLDAPLDLEPDHTYFVSAFAERGRADVHFQWQDGEMRDGIGWSRPLTSDEWTAIDDVDSAFALFGHWSR